MATPVYDPALPADNSPIVSGELRAQFAGLKDEIDNKVDGPYVDGAINAQASANCNDVANLVLTVSNPPTQAQVQAIVDKLAELMNVQKRV